MHTTQEPSLTPWSRAEQRGNYALLTGLMMAGLVGFAAFSVDVSLITMAELQAQATADAASHAALMGYRLANPHTIAAGDAAADWIVQKNTVGLDIADLESVEYGEWSYTTSTFDPNGGAGPVNATRAKVSRKASNGNAVQLLLAPILGVNTYDVEADAVTASQMRAMMLVMDMSCSMMTGDQLSTTSPVAMGRLANNTFLNYMLANPQADDMLGLSMFAGVSNGPPTVANPHGVAYATNTPTLAQRPWLPLDFVVTGSALMRTRINGICHTSTSYATKDCVGPNGEFPWNKAAGSPHPTTSQVQSCTNPGPAMEQAINELTDSAKVNNTYFKGMLFFSDGEPNCGAGGGGGTAAANRAWANDIYIWSILYANGSGTPAYMASLVRGAPTAFFQNAPSAAALPALYEQVAKSMPTALVE